MTVQVYMVLELAERSNGTTDLVNETIVGKDAAKIYGVCSFREMCYQSGLLFSHVLLCLDSVLMCPSLEN